MTTGQDLRVARQARRVSLGKLAEVIGRDKGHLSRVERAADGREVTPALVRDYERALGVTVAATPSTAIAEAPDGQPGYSSSAGQTAVPTERMDGPWFGRGVGSVAEGMIDQMERRTMIMALAALGVGQTLDSGTVWELLGETTEAQSNVNHVEDWQEAAWEYGHAFLSVPRRELVTDLGADLVAVRMVLSRLSDPVQKRGLNEAAARLAGLMAMACTDLGYAREARHLWRMGRRLADASAAPEVQLWVRGHEAVLGIYQGRPLPVVLDLADRGLTIASPTPTAGTASLLAAKAQALALLGRRSDASAALRTLTATFERLPNKATEPTMYRWLEHRLRHTESFVYTAVGHTERAHLAQDRALQLYPQGLSASRCQIEMHRAECLVRAGHVADGVRHAASTLDGLPAGERGQFVTTVATRVWEAVPHTERARADAVALRDLLGARSSAGGPDV